MSEFINTRDVIGKRAVLDGILDGSLKEFKEDAITTISAHAFQGLDIESVDLPSATGAVGEYAFYYADKMTEINIPNVTSIGQYGFASCSLLTELNIPNVTSIGEYTFNNCTSLASIELPALTAIPYRAFYNCSSLAMFYLPRVKTIHANNTTNFPFQGTKSGGWIILPSVTSLDSGSFRSTYGLNYYDIGKNLSSLSGYIFYQGTYKILILRRTSGVVTASSSTVIRDISSDNTKVYVPSALIDSYKTATNWSAKGDIFYALEGSEYEHYYANGVGVFQDVTTTLTNVTSSHAADDDIVSYGSTYSTTLTADNGMSITSVSVMHDGADVTSTVYNSTTGTISIPEVTGSIAITATAE